MLPAIPSIQRLFLVGCPRSGTTLLQSLLAAHSSIISFPESHLFMATPSRSGVAKFLDESSLSSYKAHIPPRPGPKVQFLGGVLNILDTVARDANKTAWLEKSPPHLHRIGTIEQTGSAQFIHVVRNAPDAIASLYEVRLRQPGLGGWEPPNIDTPIQRWIDDTKISHSHQGKDRHILVRYEALVSDPSSELKRVLSFIGLDFQPLILSDYAEKAKGLILPSEHWKSQNTQPITNRNGIKFKTIFNASQQEYVMQKLGSPEKYPV